MALTTTTEEVAGRVPITVLALEGELDASNFEHLIDDVRGLYDRGTRSLLVDLAGLTFLASSGLVALHSIVRILHGERPDDLDSGWDVLHHLGDDAATGNEMQRDVQLAAPQPAVARVVQRTGMDRLFVIHESRDAGIAAF
ncbi:MAG: STAS domain-containing protein [Chloroflexota bacterium]